MRQKTLAESKFGKYVAYAVGEIVLVVIGILIALSINNWNQEQQQIKVLNNIYATIKVDLQQDIKNIDEIIAATEPMKIDYLAIINKTRKKEDFENCENCRYVNMGYPDIKLRKNGIELYQNYNQQNNTSNDTLSIKLNRLYIDLPNKIAVDLDELAYHSNSFLENIKYTQPWLADHDFNKASAYSDGFVAYALTDIGYRNTAKILYEMLFYNYIPHLKAYKAQSLEIIDLIAQKTASE